MSRRLAKAFKEARNREVGSDLESYAKGRMAAAADRLRKRHWRDGDEPHPIVHLYEYWLLRMMGYDALSDELRYTGYRFEDGRPILREPDMTPAWKWWSGVNWQTRLKLGRTYRAIMRGQCIAQQQAAEAVLALSNPAFEVVYERPKRLTQ
jgi:hypothetical protein